MPYNPSEIGTSTEAERINFVRFLLGGSVVDSELSDDEITFSLNSTNDSVYSAASMCAYNLYAKYSRLVEVEIEDILREDYSNIASNYLKLHSTLKRNFVDQRGLTVEFGCTTSEKFTLDQFSINE